MLNAILILIGLSVPTVQPSDFQVGRTWTWDYVDQTNLVYSTESYTVLSKTGTTVLIEMSSAYGGATVLQPSTRLLVDVAQCLNAYKNPVQKKSWGFTMFSLVDGKWAPYDAPKTLAFEEKFNCNPWVQTDTSSNYLTVFKTIDGQATFSQKLWRKLNSSWFSLQGPNAGVAFEKDFDADPSISYRLQRRP